MDGESVCSGKDNQTKAVTVEKWWQILVQVSIPFLIAGCGTIGAGVILGNVKVIFI
jgi:solute carrier family 41